MSLRPAIGLEMLDEVASALLENDLENALEDVPLGLQHGTKKWPLGRYLRRQLRARIGREKNAPEIQAQKEEMQALRKIAWDTKTPLSKVILAKTLGRRIQHERREQRRKRNAI